MKLDHVTLDHSLKCLRYKKEGGSLELDLVAVEHVKLHLAKATDKGHKVNPSRRDNFRFNSLNEFIHTNLELIFDV